MIYVLSKFSHPLNVVIIAASLISSLVSPAIATAGAKICQCWKGITVEEELYSASENGDIESVRRLLLQLQQNFRSNGTYPDSDAFLIALKKGHEKIVDQFIKTRKYIKTQVTTNRSTLMIGVDPFDPLIVAIQAGQMKVIKMLIRHRFSPNMQSSLSDTALSIATEVGRADIVKVLLEAGADPNLIWKSKYPLMIAVANRDVIISNLLIKWGADPNRVMEYFLPLTPENSVSITYVGSPRLFAEANNYTEIMDIIHRRESVEEINEYESSIFDQLMALKRKDITHFEEHLKAYWADMADWHERTTRLHKEKVKKKHVLFKPDQVIDVVLDKKFSAPTPTGY